MNIKDILRRKKELTTIEQVLDKDKVQQITSDFVENHMATAQAVIILWGTPDGEIRLAIGGGIQNECTALGILRFAEEIIIKEGVPDD